jgi:spore maturation protein CgeB
VDNPQAARLYRHALAGLNYYRREAEDTWEGEAWAMGPREVEMAAIGLPFLRDPRGEGDEVLSMLPRFSSPAEASEQLRWLLAHEREREAMAAQAREAVAGRTFEGNAKHFLSMLEKL